MVAGLAIASAIADILAVLITVVIGIILLVLVLLGLIIFQRKNKQVISKKEIRRIFFLIIIYFIFKIIFASTIFIGEQRIIEQYKLVFSPILIIFDFIPIYLFFIFLRSKLVANKVLLNGDIPSLVDAVKNIFNSNEFYSAISNVLPKGENDRKYGLDYIPYMLQNTEARRKRFKKTSTTFLVLTISLSLLFVVIVVFFAYLLIDETVSGKYRIFVELNDSINEFEQIAHRLPRNIFDDSQFTNETGDYVLFIKNYDPTSFSEVGIQAVQKILVELSIFENRHNLDNFYSNIAKLYNSFPKSDFEKNREYFQNIGKLMEYLQTYQQLRKNDPEEIVRISDSLRRMINQANKEIVDDPNAKQNDLIKRLVLSVVVVSFLIMILRYVRNLYQNHYNEMIKAENQDLMIRKFYITLKSSEGNVEERKLVLSSFLSDVQTIENIPKAKAKSKKTENEIIKDILDIIMKKV